MQDYSRMAGHLNPPKWRGRSAIFFANEIVLKNISYIKYFVLSVGLYKVIETPESYFIGIILVYSGSKN